MGAYMIAWAVIVFAGLAGAFGLWKLCSFTQWGLAKWLAATLAMTFFCVPMVVPNHTEQLAPAFVVAIFEMFFQIDGQPQASLRILGLSLAAVLLVTLFGYYFWQKRVRRVTSARSE